MFDLLFHPFSFWYNFQKLLQCMHVTNEIALSKTEKKDFVRMLDMGGEL